MCCGEGGTVKTNMTGVCGECSQCLGHTGFVPAHGACTFVAYTAQSPGCSARELSKASPGLCALPRSKLLRFRFSGTPQRHRLSWACALCPSQVWAAQATRCLASALSQVWGRSYHLCIPSPSVSWVCSKSTISGVLCVSSGELISDLQPSWWMSTVQDPRKTWLATRSLLTVLWRMPSLGPRLPLTFWLFPSPVCLSASSGGRHQSAAG